MILALDLQCSKLCKLRVEKLCHAQKMLCYSIDYRSMSDDRYYYYYYDYVYVYNSQEQIT